MSETISIDNVTNSILKTIGEAVTIINVNGEVLYWNEGAEEMYNIKQNEIVNKNIQNYFNHKDLMVFNMLKTEQPIKDAYHQPRFDKHVLINCSPIYNNARQLIGAISIEKDITQTVKLNEKLYTTSNELQKLKNKFKNNITQYFADIIGDSPKIKETINLAFKVAATEETVMILGESGVGKELFAKAIHELSTRNKKPLIPINCGAIPGPLFESELFGYEKGAYTGAVKEGKKGKLELADGGTIFLDEIGELPLDMQVKLLRVLQEKEVYPIGSNSPREIDVRFICATNRDLEQMVQEGAFREDLYYRLNVFTLQIPPLRERINDIHILVQTFFNELAVKYKKMPPKISDDAMNYFLSYGWPGNIRELKNIIKQLFILNEHNRISLNDVKQVIPEGNTYLQPRYLKDEKALLEKERILETLNKTFGNKSMAAKKLGISRTSLYNKLNKYDIEFKRNF